MSGLRSATDRGVECLSRVPGCELAAGTPDVRGWDVTSPTSVRLGVVKDLIVDLESLRVRYLDVVLDAEHRTPRRVLLPIGKVWINDALDEVVIPASTPFDALPTYDPARFDRAFEHEVLAAFGDDVATDFYTVSAFDSGTARQVDQQFDCARRQTDPAGAVCPIDEASATGAEAANGVELKIVPEAAD